MRNKSDVIDTPRLTFKPTLSYLSHLLPNYFTWCTIPEPGGTTSMLRKAVDPHLRKANLSLFLRNSRSILACTAFSDLATSTCTEWSITRSTGTCKFRMRDGKTKTENITAKVTWYTSKWFTFHNNWMLM